MFSKKNMKELNQFLSILVIIHSINFVNIDYLEVHNQFKTFKFGHVCDSHNLKSP